jgi:Ti-type conjugative transfer relaxase TraA
MMSDAVTVPVRIDARSHAECGLQMEPTRHVGVHATAIARRGGDAERQAIDTEASAKNARAVMERPAAVLDIITREKSVFDQRDIARALHRYIADPAAYQTALAKVMACPDLMKLQDEYRGEDGRTIGAKFTTRAMFATERDMAERVDRMAQAKGFAVEADRAIARVEREKGFAFKDEQAAAVYHLAGDARVAAVAGMAGAGKSTMLGAANAAWTMGGHRVFGAALSGKAAEGLEESSGIKSHTLAKWEHQWKQGKMHLQRGDVFVIDEAGMVGSEQLARFVKAADQAGAKLVLVGDAEQLQAINAGAAFRAITDRAGCVDLEVITRQKEGWMQKASVAFGQARTGDALAVYAEHGAVQFHEDKAATAQAVIRDAVSDAIQRPEASRIVLAHRNEDVRSLNEGIRADLKSAGKLGADATFQTEQGEREFAEGDRIVFLENSTKLGVKNGTLGTVVAAQNGSLTVRVDGRGGAREIAKHYLGQAVNVLTGRTLIDTRKPVFVTVNDQSYAKVAHGYATTIHKSQGATVDRAFVMASNSMDRHLAYVAMTRHKHEAKLYADRGEFADMAALSGRLGRSNAKETTLDYTLRRGLAPASEIVLPPEMAPQPPAAQSAADAIREKFAREREGRADPFKAAAERQRRQSGAGETAPKQTLEQQVAALKEAGQRLKEREQQKQIDELRRAAARLKEREQLAAKEAAKEKAREIREQFKAERERADKGMGR